MWSDSPGTERRGRTETRPAHARRAVRAGRHERAQRALLHQPRAWCRRRSARGRSGFYSRDHVGRLELVQELQSHGFTLSAIEKYVAGIPADATPEDLALARTMLAPWDVERPIEMTPRRAVHPRRSRPDRRRPAHPGRARRGVPAQARPVPGGGLPALGRPRPARPRLPDRGGAGRRRPLRPARPRDRQGALRRVPHHGLAGLPRPGRLARDRAPGGGEDQAALDRRAWCRRTRPAWTRPSARASPGAPADGYLPACP